MPTPKIDPSDLPDAEGSSMRVGGGAGITLLYLTTLAAATTLLILL